jgi:hypothetical protein
MAEPRVDHPTLHAFAAVAEQFCALIEGHEAYGGLQFLTAVHPVLAHLYAAALDLPDTSILFDDDQDPEDGTPDDAVEQAGGPTEHEPDPDRLELESWKRLFKSLQAKFGEREFYREIFDPYESREEAPELYGSLSDDLADIYRDVRSGLLKWRRGDSGEALWEWWFHFEIHWGEHASGAVRAMYALSRWRDVPWPQGAPGAPVDVEAEPPAR